MRENERIILSSRENTYPSWEESAEELHPKQRIAAEAAFFQSFVNMAGKDAKERLPWLRAQVDGRKKQVLNTYILGTLDAFILLKSGTEAVEEFKETWGNKSNYFLRQAKRISPALEEERNRIFSEAKRYDPYDVEKIKRETHGEMSRFSKEKRSSLYDQVDLSPEKTQELFKRWGITVGANAVSLLAIDAAAAAVGSVAVKSNTLDKLDTNTLWPILAATFVPLGHSMYTNIKANWRLLEATDTSLNASSKFMYDIVKKRTGNKKVHKTAAGVGYGGQEAVKEVPWAAGTVGAVQADKLSVEEGMIFYSGANMGGAAYEYSVAWGTNTFLKWRRNRINKKRPFTDKS